MGIIQDLYKRKKHTHIRVFHEISHSSHDIIGWIKKEEKKILKKKRLIKSIQGGLHFVLLTSMIFVVLLCVSNWPAYSAFARAIIAPDALENEKINIENSIVNIEMSNKRSIKEKREQIRNKLLLKQIEQSNSITPELGVEHFDQDVTQVSLLVNIAPYDDRIVIPKIGKNIPLVNVEHHNASSSDEWHKIFMKELEKGIIKYPGSANPGEKGNSFIFGHSSNYPWAKGNYNDVFALLNELVYGDEIIVYYKQKKIVYVVKEKLVVKPGHVSSLGGDDNLQRLTLMTCWPLGTTLNRLLVITELKSTS